MWSDLLWLAAVAIAAVACALGAPLSTPMDRALPVVGAAIVVVAWIVRGSRWPPAILCGVPLLVACAVVLPSEPLRLAAYGFVVAAAFCGALLAAGELTPAASAQFVVVGIALLRWLGRENVEVGREAIILAGALAIVAVMPHRSVLPVAIALLAALFAPAFPARTMFVPLLVAGGAWMLRIRLTLAPVLAVALMLVLFPWSGAAARAFPWFLRHEPAFPAGSLGYALSPGQAIDIDVPPDARWLAVSVANGLAFPRGRTVGTIGTRPIRMGEIADWGAGRREVWWRARVALAAAPARSIRGYGYDAWLEGAGRVPVSGRRIHVVADASMPANARLQLEEFQR